MVVWVSVFTEIDVDNGVLLSLSDRPVVLARGLAKLKRWWKARGVWTEDASVMEDIAVMRVALVAMVHQKTRGWDSKLHSIANFIF